MKKVYNNGFTLTEALLALGIVGLLAILVLPGVVKDAMSRANMAALQSTIISLEDLLSNEIVNTSSHDLADSSLVREPEEFIKKLNTTKTKRNASLMSNSPLSEVNVSAILANGVIIDIGKYSTTNVASVPIAIDTNGKKDPNVLGIDRFETFIATRKQEVTQGGITKNYNIGQLGNTTTNKPGETDLAGKITACRGGDGVACFDAAIMSNYNPNYLD